MPRKRSSSGRARGLSIESRLIRTIEKANKALNNLEKARMYGTYASRKFLDSNVNNPAYIYKRKSKIKFKLKKSPRDMTTQEQLLHLKTFEKFLKAPTSKVSGVETAETVTKERVKKSLGEIAEKKLTDEDVEDFYALMYEDDFKYFLQYLDPSELFAIIQEAKEQSWGENEFVKILEQYITINLEETRNRAKRLYEKYVL